MGLNAVDILDLKFSVKKRLFIHLLNPIIFHVLKSVVSPLLILGFLISFSNIVYSQVSADFSVDDSEGCAPHALQFFNASIGSVNFIQWDFNSDGTIDLAGDPTDENFNNPFWTYNNPGDYSVTLIVSNGFASDTLTKTDFISVFEPPVAFFEGTPQTGCGSQLVEFTDLSSSGSAPIVSWNWGFGDGQTSGLQSPTHQYNPGSYQVSLFIVDANGCESNALVPNFINIDEGVSPSFTVTPNSGCNEELTIEITNTSTGVGSLAYSWDFDNGQTSTNPNPTPVTYTVDGEYVISLTLSSEGCTQTVTDTVYLESQPEASFITDLGCQGSATVFENTSSNVFTSYFWDFGDGIGTSNDQSPSYIYSLAGTYNVTLNMVGSNGDCTGSITLPVEVPSAPALSVEVSSHTVCELPLSVLVDITNDEIATVNWAVVDEDGFAIDGGNSAPFFINFGSSTDDGNYFLQMEVVFQSGCVVNYTDPQAFEVVTPIIDGFVEPLIGCVPIEVEFINTSSHVYGIDSVSWDIFYLDTEGNPAVPYLMNVTDNEFTYTFTEGGFYPVILTVYTHDGCAPSTLINFLTFGNHTYPDFEFPEDTVCIFKDSLQYTYTGTTPLDSITSFTWSGPGWGSDQPDPYLPIQADPDTGYFVMLITENFGCFDTVYHTIDSLIGLGPRPVLTPDTTLFCIYDNPYDVEFENNTIYTDSTYLEWNIPSLGITSSDTLIDEVVFPGPGLYFAFLTAWDYATTGCTLTVDVPILVDGFQVDGLLIPDTAYCFGEQFINRPFSSDVVLIDINANEYQWSMGDGLDTLTTVSDTTVFEYYYTQPGTYDFTLIGQNQFGCYDTLEREIVIAKNPQADFTWPDTIDCPPYDLPLIDLTTLGDTTIETWIWEYFSILGSGGISGSVIGPDPLIPIEFPTTYGIRLIVKDYYGCDDTTDYRPIENNLEKFEVDNQSVCNDTLYQIEYDIEGKHEPLVIGWVFNNSPDTLFSDEPMIDINNVLQDSTIQCEVVVTDTVGCTYQANFEIFVSVPQLSFNVEFDTLSCNPELAVSYTFSISSNAPGVEYYEIDFADGQSFYTNDPAGASDVTYFFNQPGFLGVTYRVRAGGCFTERDTSIFIPGTGASFSWTTDDVCPPLDVEFLIDGDTAGLGLYTWDFGDGSMPVDLINPYTHPYVNAGFYIPKLLFTTSIGDTLSCKVAVSGDPIIIDGPGLSFTFNDDSLCFGTDLVISNESTNGSVFEVNVWEWSFGDDSPNQVQNTVIPTDPLPYGYEEAGDFEVVLTARTEAGCEYVLKDTVTVIPPLELQPDINFEPGCVPLTVTFNPDVSGNIDLIEFPFWQFGDDNTSTELMPEHTYVVENQTFYPILQYSYGGCNFEIELDAIVPATPPTAAFEANPVIDNAQVGSFNLIDQSIDAETIDWYYSGLYISSLPSVEVEVGQEPVEITLIATNIIGCTDTISEFIEGVYVKPVNIISPNGDGMNDYLVFHDPEKEFCLDLTIYNRWGKLIFDDSAYQNDWSGISNNGDEVAEGTYFWVLDVCGQTTLTGYVTIVR